LCWHRSFSALRIDGKRAFDYARQGKELPKELEPRSVNVTELELVEWYDQHSFRVPEQDAPEKEKEDAAAAISAVEHIEVPSKNLEEPKNEESKSAMIGPACVLKMTVSSGFYVRSLCHDLGLKLNSSAYMADLVRTRVSTFKLEDALDGENFLKDPNGPWEEKLISILAECGKK
jgi:tRNA pseudouridine55 synthase